MYQISLFFNLIEFEQKEVTRSYARYIFKLKCMKKTLCGIKKSKTIPPIAFIKIKAIANPSYGILL